MLATVTLRKPQDAEAVARLILASHPTRRVFAVQGDLGAGKTTLIKAFCKVLGVKGHTSSPSFAIVNEYRGAAGAPVYHFDLYRLRDPGELDGIGFTEYVDSGAWCFVEWPELADDLLPPGAAVLHLTADPAGVRTIGISVR